VEVDLSKIGAQERFAAGEPDRQASQVCRLIEDVFHHRCGHFPPDEVFTLMGLADIAMYAVVVAALGQLDIKVCQFGTAMLPEGFPGGILAKDV
jgi:hypothetical protein